jgi:hypothetical protein
MNCAYSSRAQGFDISIVARKASGDGARVGEVPLLLEEVDDDDCRHRALVALGIGREHGSSSCQFKN